MSVRDIKTYSKYEAHVIDGVNKKRQLSINELNKSCLETKNRLSEVNLWYQGIIKCIQAKPPDNYVEYLTVFQDSKGDVYKIEYKYAKKNTPPHDIDFVIILWNDTE